jgi:tRNA U34 2-thiouridine synthase MnmA/TrmU
LDSCLSTKLITLQGIDVTALYFNMPFCSSSYPAVQGAQEEISTPHLDSLCERAELVGAKFRVYTTGQDYVDMVRSPQYGYGKNINPCIDCKIFFYKCAHEIMKQEGAQFIITGEVLGQRPMTQNLQTLDNMAKRAGVEGLVLRPLSAKLLPPTIPEEKEWVDRERLLDIQGRSRTRQMALAEQWGISDYPTPAGGCLLTDKNFSSRLRDLFSHGVSDINNITMLKYARHFRLSEDVKLIVGRDEKDNDAISRLVEEDDILMEAPDFGSPLCILRGPHSADFVDEAARICKRYSSGRKEKEIQVRVWKIGEGEPYFVAVSGQIDENIVKKRMIL